MNHVSTMTMTVQNAATANNVALSRRGAARHIVGCEPNGDHERIVGDLSRKRECVDAVDLGCGDV